MSTKLSFIVLVVSVSGLTPSHLSPFYLDNVDDDANEMYSDFMASQRRTLDFLFSTEAEPNVPNGEYNALRDLYIATNGPQWVFPQNFTGNPWNFTGEIKISGY